MAIEPTDEECARYILKIMVSDFTLRAGQCLPIGSLYKPFSKNPWKTSDIDRGAMYGVEKGWFTVWKVGGLCLTNLGYAEA